MISTTPIDGAALDDAIAAANARPDWFGINPVPDILAEQRQGRSLRQGEIDRFLQMGVDIRALVKPAMLLVDQILLNENGSFEFARCHPNSEPVAAFTVPVLSAGSVEDIAAWCPSTGTMSSYCRRAFCLGQDELDEANMAQGSIVIWRDLRGWLKANRSGAVILDKRRAWHMFDAVEKVITEDDANAAELSRYLWTPRRKAPIHVLEAVA